MTNINNTSHIVQNANNIVYTLPGPIPFQLNSNIMSNSVNDLNLIESIMILFYASSTILSDSDIIRQEYSNYLQDIQRQNKQGWPEIMLHVEHNVNFHKVIEISLLKENFVSNTKNVYTLLHRLVYIEHKKLALRTSDKYADILEKRDASTPAAAATVAVVASMSIVDFFSLVEKNIKLYIRTHSNNKTYEHVLAKSIIRLLR